MSQSFQLAFIENRYRLNVNEVMKLTVAPINPIVAQTTPIPTS